MSEQNPYLDEEQHAENAAEQQETKVSAKNRLQEGVILAFLLKGPIYIEDDAILFRNLIEKQIEVESLAQKLGLTIFIDEPEGYAFARSMKAEEYPDDYGQRPPALIVKRPLSYPVSLLLVLLRQRLMEYDESAESLGRLVLTYEELTEMQRMYLPKTSNEAAQQKRIEATIGKVCELGFLRELSNTGLTRRFEVRRILKALVQASSLEQVKKRLEELVSEKEAKDE